VWISLASTGNGLAIVAFGFICLQEGAMKNKTVIAVLLMMALAGGSFAQESKRAVKTASKPIFPELAKRMNVAGSVKVECVVAPNGTVKSAKALGGHPLLIDSALAAAKNSKFEPAAEETKELITYNFNNNAN
jgi:TonB family protein